MYFQRLPERIREAKVVVLPQFPRHFAELLLLAPMRLKLADQRTGNHQRAHLPALRLAELPVPAETLRAVLSVESTVRPTRYRAPVLVLLAGLSARVSVPFLPALVRVVTAVPITRPLELEDAKGARLEIDAPPAHSERFALPQAEGQRDRPARTVRQNGRQIENAPSLLLGQRLDLLVAVRRCFDVLRARHIPCHLPPTHSHLQRARKDLVNQSN
jgi:hypothetical protein